MTSYESWCHLLVGKMDASLPNDRFVLNYESSQAENSYFKNSEKGSRAWQKCPSRKSKHFVLIPCSPITFLIYILVRCLLGMLLSTDLSDYADGQVWENKSFLRQSKLSEVEQWESFTGPDHPRIKWPL